MVWYVSYGSNLLAERFAVYLEGGAPPGRTQVQAGARDASRWQDDRPVMVPHRLFFAGESRWWDGGGVAFVDPAPGEALTRGRAYLVTAEQFQDVLAQESGRAVGSEVDWAPAVADGSVRLGDNGYDLVIHLGDADGWPMVTFTTPRPPAEHQLNAPGVSYRSTITQGLAQSHGLSGAQADEYLSRWSVLSRG